MKVGAEDKKKLGVLAVVGTLALGAVFYIYSELSPPSVSPPAALVVSSTPAPRRTPARTQAESTPTGVPAGFIVGQKELSPEAKLDPTLHMEAMRVTESLVYTGTGRNIFSMNSAPPPAEQKMLARAHTPAPIAPVRTGPTGPPPPPPIDLKFFGTARVGNGEEQACLLHGEDVFLASPGDIVQRRYRIVSISAHSIVVEDIPNNDRQTLPLEVQ